MLGALIAPWHAAMRKLGTVAPWAYVDDRSVKAARSNRRKRKLTHEYLDSLSEAVPVAIPPLDSADEESRPGDDSDPESDSAWSQSSTTTRAPSDSQGGSDTGASSESGTEQTPRSRGSRALPLCPACPPRDCASEDGSSPPRGRPSRQFLSPGPIPAGKRPRDPRLASLSEVGSARRELELMHQEAVAEDLQVVNEALTLTTIIDELLGVKENTKKRQVWSGSETAEHLGIRAAAGALDPDLPKPRDGWDTVVELTKRLTLVPGTADVRTAIGITCVASRYRWALPFLEVPPKRLVKDTFGAITRTKCKWWSQARFWTDHLSAHPVLGTAIQAIKMAGSITNFPSVLLTKSVRAHAAVLGLELAAPISEDGIWLKPKPGQSLDPRAMTAIADRGCTDDGLFRADDAAGLHALRAIARAGLLQVTTPTERGDDEGILRVDVQASSQAEWRDWKKSLSYLDRTRLHIWRGGAVWTPTRRFRDGDARRQCQWCGHELASARHFWAECPHFDKPRQNIAASYDLPDEFWHRQPRVTAKTGWITYDADVCPIRRAKMQVAACLLGIRVIAEPMKGKDVPSKI